MLTHDAFRHWRNEIDFASTEEELRKTVKRIASACNRPVPHHCWAETASEHSGLSETDKQYSVLLFAAADRWEYLTEDSDDFRR